MGGHLDPSLNELGAGRSVVDFETLVQGMGPALAKSKEMVTLDS